MLHSQRGINSGRAACIAAHAKIAPYCLLLAASTITLLVTDLLKQLQTRNMRAKRCGRKVIFVGSRTLEHKVRN